MGIDLYPFGVNANDAGDVDYGCNDLMNFPVISDVTLDGGRDRKSTRLNSSHTDISRMPSSA